MNFISPRNSSYPNRAYHRYRGNLDEAKEKEDEEGDNDYDGDGSSCFNLSVSDTLNEGTLTEGTLTEGSDIGPAVVATTRPASAHA